MVINKLDGITFRLKRLHDFSWLKKYGTAFCAIDETGSGCICIGMQNTSTRYFCKIAGVDTIDAAVPPQESVEILKKSVQLYKDLQHQNLTEIIETYEHDDLYIIVFRWVDGECLFDHWNFDKYAKNPFVKSPAEKFRKIPAKVKLNVIEILFSFFETVSKANYVAVDFYDGSIMYDFSTNTTTICDIDLFRRKPIVNSMGIEWFGTKRLKAPEEYIIGARIDEDTNVFTLGALIFNFFGCFSKADIAKRYEKNQFFPCSLDKWQLGKEGYLVALTATDMDRVKRFQSISEFHSAWESAYSVK